MLRYFILKIISMKRYLFFLLSIFILFDTKSQSLPTWYNLHNIDVSDYFYSMPSYKIKDEKFAFSGIPDEMTNFAYSSLTFAESTESIVTFRSQLIICRGTLKNKEVVIIDKDFNRVVSSDEVFELPELGLSKEIPYNSTYLYPTEVKIPIEVEYDYVKNGQLYQIPHKLVVTVMSRYDASSRALYYDNTCKFSHYHKLSLEMKVGTNNIDITCNDHLPWDDLYTFTLNQNGVKNKLNLKDKFKIDNSNEIFLIDSFDFLNKRVLVKAVSELSKIKFSGNTINDFGYFDSSTLNSDTTIIHFWGSWCRPCIKNLPKLKLLSKNHTKVGLIGVSVVGSVEASMKIINEIELCWPQLHFKTEEELFENSSEHITSFSSYYLVGKDHSILAKFSSIDDVERYLNYKD